MYHQYFLKININTPKIIKTFKYVIKVQLTQDENSIDKTYLNIYNIMKTVPEFSVYPTFDSMCSKSQVYISFSSKFNIILKYKV